MRERASLEREVAINAGDDRWMQREYDSPPSQTALRDRVDEYFNYANVTYTWKEADPADPKKTVTRTVQARPHFRITGSAGGGPARCLTFTNHDQLQGCIISNLRSRIEKFDRKLMTPWLRTAIHRAAYGRGSVVGIQKITQILIDAGELAETKKRHPGLNDVDSVRMLQWDFGYGMDCAGYVQRAFLFVWENDKEETVAMRQKYAFRTLGNENLYALASNPKFRKVKYDEAQSGDLFILSPPRGDDAGHTVLVRNRTTFTQGSDTIHKIEVDASWGAGASGNLRGGVQRRSFVYNPKSNKWGDVKDDGTITWNSIGPYKNHPVQGMYRPK